MIQTLTLPWATCIHCGGTTGPEIAPGDTVLLVLRQDVDNELPATITGAVQSVETPVDATTSRIYTINYDTDDLGGAVDLLLACMVSAITCVSCCDLLQEQVDALDVRVTAAELTLVNHEERLDSAEATIVELENDFNLHVFYIPGPGTTHQLVVYHNGENGPFAYSWRDPNDDEIGVTPIVEIPDSDLSTFIGGYYKVVVTHNPSGLQKTYPVYVNPQRIFFRTENTTITTGNSTKVVALNAGETISSVIQTTAGSGIRLESITYVGLNATLTFSGVPSVSPVNLQLLIQRSLP